MHRAQTARGTLLVPAAWSAGTPAPWLAIARAMLVTLRSSCFKSTRHTLARHIRSRGIRAMTTAAPAEEVAVVGGGIAGLTCASLLAKGGYSVTLLDMGKSHPGERSAACDLVPAHGGRDPIVGCTPRLRPAAGGRTTTRRTAHMDLVFDHGAQFFRCQSAEFQAVVEEWQAAGGAQAALPALGRGSATRGRLPAPWSGSRGRGHVCLHAIHSWRPSADAGVVATWDGRIGLYSARTGSFTPKEQLVKQQQEQEQPGPDGQRESG
jgi:hypothetical protein